MKKKIYFILSGLSLANYPAWSAPAGPNSSLNFSDFSTNVLSFVGILLGVLFKISLILGVCFFLSSLIQFKNYRDNPSQVPISRPFY
jgi:hypothetical protein